MKKTGFVAAFTEHDINLDFVSSELWLAQEEALAGEKIFEIEYDTETEDVTVITTHQANLDF